MRISRTILLALLAFAHTGISQSLKYYVDAAGGNDANDGRSAAKAWQTLAKVSATQFQPGDSVLFKAASVWTGQLVLQGSGAKGAPIVVDMYGGTVKPRIDGNGIVGTATVYLNNGKFWEINNLEITNDAPSAGDRRGVLVTASDFGLVEHIYLRNLNIHNVKGIVGQDDAQKRTAGIGIETASDKLADTRYDDILIEGCTISFIENTGLYTDHLLFRNTPGTADWTRRRFTNVRIRNNTIHHIAKNAMIVRILDGGLVERNVCYETALQATGNTMFTSACNGTVFQYNEGYYNRATENTPGGGDGSMYDADLKSSNIIFQYSYSHDNSHGLFWNATVQGDSGIICRYNISRNDKGIIFCVDYPVTSIYIYNNTVYLGPGLSPIIISERNVNSGSRKYVFSNNIIYNESTSARYDFRSSGYTRTIDNNVFYGSNPSNEPADPNKLTTDPKLVNPASGGTGLNTLDGFKLQSDSPCINSGIQLEGHSTLDFWGNPVPSGVKVDRGAYEYAAASRPTRYLDEVFENYQLQSNIQFGQISTKTLFLDLYSGAGDTMKNRPLVIFIHGGGFKGGDKVSNFGTLVCGGLAKRGYVVASIDYRVTSTIPNDTAHIEAMLKALQDSKSAVRFFRKNATTYGIDANQIFATGTSAGSITALHLAYLDSVEVPKYVSWGNVGGSFEGTSGNPGFSSRIQGVISNWGAIGDTAWMKAGDVPVYCVHGTSDVTVFYDQIPADGPFLFGSKFIYAAAQRVGLTAGIRLFSNTGHTLDNNPAKQDSAIRDFSGWLYTILKPTRTTTDVRQKGASVPTTIKLQQNYPNPFNPATTISYELPAAAQISLRVYNLLGQVVATLVDDMKSAGRHNVVFDASLCSAGTYVYQLRIGQIMQTQKMLLLK